MDWAIALMGVAGLVIAVERAVVLFRSSGRDALFAVFAVAFWLLAFNQGVAALAQVPREDLAWVYLLRLLAFLLIIIAIVRKNLRGRAP